MDIFILDLNLRAYFFSQCIQVLGILQIDP